jgi:uncharacterized protein (UPF0276 family)
VHGVCMSIGGPQPLDKAHLERFRSLVERYEPALVSSSVRTMETAPAPGTILFTGKL